MMHNLLVIAAVVGSVQAQTHTGFYTRGRDAAISATHGPTRTQRLPRAVAASTSGTGQGAAVTGCHNHGSDVYCIDGEGHEVSVSLASTPTGETPTKYTDCHSHGDQQFCVGPDGSEVQIVEDGATASDGAKPSQGSGEESGEVHCHFHAGVEHCVGAGESESSSSQSCNSRDRDYDVPLRIGTLFAVLATSGIGVFAPMLLVKLPFKTLNTMVSTAIKQFGTGVIISTALVHLATHASLMFNNECIGELQYEATTSAIIMAGIFLSFLVEYVGHRIVHSRISKSGSSDSFKPDGQPSGAGVCQHQYAAELSQLSHSHGPADPTSPDTKFSVLVMEAGVLFHSVIIGVTLVVAGDSFYKTLLVVIVFHQFFEGLALGARIASLPAKIFPSKALMAGSFALITPIGMAIGIGVLNSFNGNDRDTLIALGTLDALSAGILVWVGVVDMWARDWVIDGGAMVDVGAAKGAVGGISLVAGLVLMSLLGKWA